MKKVITLAVSFISAIAFYSNANCQEEIISALTSNFESQGYSVLKTEVASVTDQGFKFYHQFYPGNKYSVIFFPTEQGASPVQMKLSTKNNPQKEVRRSSEREILEIQLNSINAEKPFEGVVEVSLKDKNSNNNNGIIFICYKSGSKMSDESEPNSPENYYYSLAGMEYLPRVKKANQDIAKTEAKDVFEQNGYSISLLETMSFSIENDSTSHTFYEGNEYFIYAYSVDQIPVKIEVYREDMWSELGEKFKELLDSPESDKVTTGEQGNLQLDFREAGLLRSVRGIKISTTGSLPTDEIILVIGYKSKSNLTGLASNNSEEDFFFNQR